MTRDVSRHEHGHCDTCGAVYKVPPADLGQDCPACGDGDIRG